MLMSGVLDLLLPLPLYLLLLLGVLAWIAWRAGPGAGAHRLRWVWTGGVLWAWLLSAPITIGLIYLSLLIAYAILFLLMLAGIGLILNKVLVE